MKKILSAKSMITVMNLLLTAVLVTACGTDNNNLSAPPENTPNQEENFTPEDNGANNPEENQGVQTGHSFKKFDLEVKYRDNVKYEADFEAEGNGEAEIEDDITNKKLKGDEAYQELSPKLEQLKFDPNSEDQEVLTQVLEVFGLQDDFTEFELEVTFADGTRKEYKLVQ
ncbi:YusW family protein [Sutcliffiella halmapala]|uniref:YusW family protein n=1 Tax=Sutcliffiella halmapala TaxID=79882 RepID=UPI000995B061|nr:YusW family protein [Sutcliffiella halmapala]